MKIALMTIPAVLLAAPVQAAETRLSSDVTTSVGYSNNPFSEVGSNTGSGFFEIGVRPRADIITERTTVSVSGYAQLQDYFRNYSNSNSYGGAVDLATKESDRLTTHAQVRYDSSIIGTSDAFSGTVSDPSLAPVTTVVGTDIGLYGTRDRRRLFTAEGDFDDQVSAHGDIHGNAFFTANRYSAFSELGNYNSYGGTLGYGQQLNSKWKVGIQGSVSNSDYGDLRGSTRVISVQPTVQAQFTVRWSLTAAAGVSFVRGDDFGGGSTTFSGNIQLCRTGARDRLCLSALRQVLPTGFAGVQNETSVSATYTYKLSERSNVTANLSWTKNGRDGLQSQDLFVNTNEYLRAGLGFDHQLYKRLHLNTSAFYRQIYGGGFDRHADAGGQVGVTYHIGDLR